MIKAILILVALLAITYLSGMITGVMLQRYAIKKVWEESE